MKTIFFTLLSVVSFSLVSSAQNRQTHYFEGRERASTAVFAFPNPATNYVTVSLPFQAAGQVDLLVMDFNGNIIRNHRFAPGASNYSIDISYLEQGMYILRVNENSRFIGSIKLVKNR